MRPTSMVWRMKHELEFSDVMQEMMNVKVGDCYFVHTKRIFTITVHTKPLVRSSCRLLPSYFVCQDGNVSTVSHDYSSYSSYIFARLFQMRQSK